MTWRVWLGLALAAASPAAAHMALCGAAIAAAEAATRIPDAFLHAIGRVESGRPAEPGAREPWPWTINEEGQGHFYPTKAAAIDAVRALQARGVRSIDVGCLQVNLQQHPAAFATLEQAFDPGVNAAYAARLLMQLFRQTGSWPRAAAAYHSLTPAIGADYQQKVLAAWAIPEDRPDAAPIDAPLRPTGLLPPAGALPVPAFAGPALGGGFAARVLRLPAAAGAAAAGRDLAAYRRAPVRLATTFHPR